jgi:hypothetical protein
MILLRSLLQRLLSGGVNTGKHKLNTEREWVSILAVTLLPFFCSIWELWMVFMGVSWVFRGVINNV